MHLLLLHKTKTKRKNDTDKEKTSSKSNKAKRVHYYKKKQHDDVTRSWLFVHFVEDVTILKRTVYLYDCRNVLKFKFVVIRNKCFRHVVTFQSYQIFSHKREP